MFWSVDRIENGQAVCINDSEQQRILPLQELPTDTQEGSVLREENGRYLLDIEEEERRRARINELLARLKRPADKEEQG